MVDMEVFKVFIQDKVRYSVLWSRSLTFQFAGPAAPAWLFEGEKKYGGCRESECEGARARELIHAAAHHDDVVSLSFFLQLAEQNVDIPVPGVRGPLAVEVFKVFTQNRVHFSLLSS